MMSASTHEDGVRLIGLRGIPEVHNGDDVAGYVLASLSEMGVALRADDIVVVTQKVISKAEGRVVDLAHVEPSAFALRFARQWNKDPRYVEVVLRESARIVRMDHGILISETRHGFVCANAGVDASNVSGGEHACLLPDDADASARRLREAIGAATGITPPIIITDSFGRPWREGIMNVAIGIAGLRPLVDYRGQPDDFGRVMSASVIAVADELASAAELVMGKVDRCPAAIVRGYPFMAGDGSSRDLVIPAARDMFR
ncbi:MAG TPA: coenzyme F420-0:L-glutamate ligase [Ktedonobacterales bacterium]